MGNKSLEISQDAQLNNSLYLYSFLSVQEQQHILQLLNYISQFKASQDELDRDQVNWIYGPHLTLT